MEAEKQDRAENFLVIGPSWVGDMVMAQALFKRLKADHVDSRISVLAPDWTRPLLERMPEVDDSIAAITGHGELGLSARRALGKSLRDRHFTTALILPNSFKSALIPFHAGIANRIAWRGEWRGLLLTDSRVLNKSKFPLMVQRFAALAQARNAEPRQEVLNPQLSIDTESQVSTLKRFKLDDERRVLAICPGAEFGSSKQWPAEHFAAACSALISASWQVWIFGSENDRTVANSILAELDESESANCINLCGKTTLGEAIDLLSLASAVISNDSGLMHIAAALDKPIVALYGSTSPDFTPPLSKRVKILSTEIDCRPCFKRECPFEHKKCLQDLAPERAVSAVIELTTGN